MKQTIKKILKISEKRGYKGLCTPENLAKSIVIESGELLEDVRRNKKYTVEYACKEFSDKLNDYILLGDTLSINIEKHLLYKIEKNRFKYSFDKAKAFFKKYREFVS